MDVTEEAFAYQEENKHEIDIDDRKLKKETWREWMNIFTQGKKISEANIIIQQDEGLVK